MKYKILIVTCIAAFTGSLGWAAAITHAKTAEENSVEAVQLEADTKIQTESDVESGITSEREQDETAAAEFPSGVGILAYLDNMGNISQTDAVPMVLALSGEEAVGVQLTIESQASEPSVQEESEQEESEYADLAIANVNNYVNVRSGPDTDSAIVGKIYSGAVAHILAVAGEEDDWFQIVSGNVEGYIKAEYFLYGDAAVEVIDQYVTRYATVIASRLNVREQPDIESSRIGYIDNGERVKVLENQGEWLKVQYTGSATGYVAAEYVTVSEEFIYAKTLEEEAKELAEKRALEERQRQSEAQAAENTTINVTPPNTSYTTNSELRQAVVDYAMQYLGNRYVHGGKSLESGTDCSGFTSLIYAEFGYSLSRTPSGQLSGAGRGIDYSEAQPGDIICYGSGGTCTHVALYIGNGQIIHSANPRKGVVTGKADFDTIIGVRNVID